VQTQKPAGKLGFFLIVCMKALSDQNQFWSTDRLRSPLRTSTKILHILKVKKKKLFPKRTPAPATDRVPANSD
jgi:hypothetical protein